MTFDDFIAEAKQVADLSYAAVTDARVEDPPVQACLLGPDGEVTVAVFFVDEHSEFAVRLIHAVVVTQAERVAILLPSWTADGKSGDVRRPTDRPDRTEAMICVAGDTEGQRRMVVAPVHRGESVMLGEWEETLGDLQGRMIDLLSAAFQAQAAVGPELLARLRAEAGR